MAELTAEQLALDEFIDDFVRWKALRSVDVEKLRAAGFAIIPLELSEAMLSRISERLGSICGPGTMSNCEPALCPCRRQICAAYSTIAGGADG